MAPDQTTHPGCVMPARPGEAARAACRPAGAFVFTDGFWGERQERNRAVSLRQGARRLREAGNLENLARAAGGERGDYRGPLFMDSDAYKWLEAVAWEHGRQPDQWLERELSEWGEVIAAAQQPDGYLNSYVQIVRGGEERYRDLAFGHELYCMGHLIQAGIAERRATGREALFAVAVRAADHLSATFGPEGLTGLEGHPVVEMALVELFRETRTAGYLELARWFVEARGHGTIDAGEREPVYFSDRVPARDADALEGHAVRAVYFAAGVVDVAVEDGDPDGGLLAAASRQWEHTSAARTHLTGGLGSRWEGEAVGDDFELTPDGAYCETCAAIGAVQWNWRLLLQSGDPRHAHMIERLLYNGFAAGVSLEGDAFFYVNALQRRTGAIGEDHRHPAHGRQGWYETACCPPNVMRTLASLGAYAATTEPGTLHLHLYASGTLAAGPFALELTTDYPWSPEVVIAVRRAPAEVSTLALRIPIWAHGAEAAIRSESGAEQLEGVAGESLRICRRFAPGDEITLTLPMAPRLTVPDARADALRGCCAIERGPLVYCLEDSDQPGETPLEDLVLAEGQLETEWREELLGGVIVVRAPGRERESERTRELRAIPYALWANRGPSAMRVWIPTAEATAR